MKIFNPVFLYLLVLSYSTSLIASDELIFGSVAMDIPAVMHIRLKPLTKYLSKRLDKKVILKLSPNMGVAINEAAQGMVDISYLTPVAYLRAHERADERAELR